MFECTDKLPLTAILFILVQQYFLKKVINGPFPLQSLERYCSPSPNISQLSTMYYPCTVQV